MTVVVLTDSTAALPPQVSREHDVHVVPLAITIDGKTFHDGELSPDELLAADVRATTSGPSPGEWLAALEGVEGATSAVIVTVAKSLSSTFTSASVAARMSPVRVEVVDSATAAGGQALVVLAAADRAAVGGTHEDVAGTARSAAEEVRLVGCLESLDQLARSGRVPSIANVAVRRLGLRTLFELRDGRVRPLLPVPSQAVALDRIVKMCVNAGGEDQVCDVVVLDAGAQEVAAELADRLVGRVRLGRHLAGSFGSAMMVHTGPGVVGLAWRWR